MSVRSEDLLLRRPLAITAWTYAGPRCGLPARVAGRCRPARLAEEGGGRGRISAYSFFRAAISGLIRVSALLARSSSASGRARMVPADREGSSRKPPE